jgi:MHS family proline/betaine transporter-like MFS transporter
LSFWGVFAIGFITRPLGAIIFGHVADVRSKQTALVSSIFTMAIATTAMGCLPTYQMAGPAAPALLAIFRAIQGLAAGGEYGTAVMYIAEIFPKKHQGMGSSAILVASGVGPGTIY